MPDAETNRPYFTHDDTVLEYARAALNVGLWESERVLLEKFVPKDARVLELGCGAGRVAVGMAKAGWRDILATDFSTPMIEAAKSVVAMTGAGVRCETADATALPYPDSGFDAAVFAFNGLLMIPGIGRRAVALREISRVLKTGGVFLFSGHDREATRTAHWREERARWDAGRPDPEADAFGDSLYGTPEGRVFIRSATEEEMRAELAAAGFDLVFSAMRSEIADEPPSVRAFSDETRLRVAVKR